MGLIRAGSKGLSAAVGTGLQAQAALGGRGLLRGVSLDALIRALFRNDEPGVWLDPSDLSTLFQERTGASATTPAGIGDPVGTILDKSGNGNHATAPSDAARPILGRVPVTGRRNLLERTEEFGNSYWAKTNLVPSAHTGSPYNAQVLTDTNDGSAVAHAIVANGANVVFSATATPKLHHALVKAGTKTKARLTLRANWADSFVDVDLTDGSVLGSSRGGGVIGSITFGVEPALDGFYHIFICAPDGLSSTADGRVALAILDDDGSLNYQGDGTGTIIVAEWQAEIATEPSAYQRVGSQFDVTEAGVRSITYVRDDGVDDALNVTLPDMGTDATVAYVTDQGVTIETGQTIGAGEFNVLRDQDLFGIIVIDRALTAAETANVTKFLESKGPAP